VVHLASSLQVGGLLGGVGMVLVRVRALSETEAGALRRLAGARAAPAREVERAQIVRLSAAGRSAPAIARELGRSEATVRLWIRRFNALGMDGLRDRARAGRPRTYAAEQVGRVVEAALSDPDALDLPFGCWTLDRLRDYVAGTLGIPMSRARIGEVLLREGLRWRAQESWFGQRVDPEFAQRRGRSSGSTPSRRRPRPSSAWTSWAPSPPRASAAGGS
jgi:transposase